MQLNREVLVAPLLHVGLSPLDVCILAQQTVVITGQFVLNVTSFVRRQRCDQLAAQSAFAHHNLGARNWLTRRVLDDVVELVTAVGNHEAADEACEQEDERDAGENPRQKLEFVQQFRPLGSLRVCLRVWHAFARDEQAVRVDHVRRARHERHDVLTRLDLEHLGIRRLDHLALVHLVGERLVPDFDEKFVPVLQPRQVREQRRIRYPAVGRDDGVRALAPSWVTRPVEQTGTELQQPVRRVVEHGQAHGNLRNRDLRNRRVGQLLLVALGRDLVVAAVRDGLVEAADARGHAFLSHLLIVGDIAVVLFLQRLGVLLGFVRLVAVNNLLILVGHPRIADERIRDHAEADENPQHDEDIEEAEAFLILLRVRCALLFAQNIGLHM